jgi:superkiller protein 3
MIAQKRTLFYKLLATLSWPESMKKPKKYIEPESFSEKVLASLSFSLASKNEISVRPKIDPTIALEFGRLWDRAHVNMRRGKFSVAEKALWTIVAMDARNAAAYNRIGIIKAKQRKFDESISMFRRAAKLENTASANHNLALVYYETEDYKKSERYFRKSIKLDGGLAARHVALAKVLERQGKDTQMFRELVRAIELEPFPGAFRILEKAYTERGMVKEAALVKEELSRTDSNKSEVSGKKYRISERSDRVGKLILSYE